MKQKFWLVYWLALCALFACALFLRWDIRFYVILYIIIVLFVEAAHSGRLNMGGMVRNEAMLAEELPPARNKFNLKGVVKLIALPVLYTLIAFALSSG